MHLYYSDWPESGKSPAWLRRAISSGLGSLMILQAAKRIVNIRFDPLPVFRWTQVNRYIVVQDWLFQFVDSPDKCEIICYCLKISLIKIFLFFFIPGLLYRCFPLFFVLYRYFVLCFLLFSIYSIFFEVILISFAFVFQVFFPSSFFMM